MEAGTNPDGTRKRHKKTIRIEDNSLLKTSKKLQNYLETQWYQFKTEVEAGTYIAPGKMTFGDFVELHWKPKYANLKLSQSTIITYERNFKTHIFPHFAHLRIDEIKTLHIVDFLTYLASPNARQIGKEGETQPLKPGTQRTIYRALHCVLTKAVEWKIISLNPAQGVSWPEKSEPDIQVYEEDEVDQIMEALTRVADKWRLMMLGTFLGGFRRGEMVALELNDLDFGDNSLRIDENIPMQLHGKPYIKGPKNKSSIRKISMPHWYMEELAMYCREWKKQRLLVGDKWEGGNKQFLFHTGYGKPYHPNTPTNWWRDFLKKNGIRHVKLHGLRHTSATFLLENGATIEAVKDRLGHTSQRSTEIYLHTTKAMEKLAAQKFDRFNLAHLKNRPQSVPNTD